MSHADDMQGIIIHASCGRMHADAKAGGGAGGGAHRLGGGHAESVIRSSKPASCAAVARGRLESHLQSRSDVPGQPLPGEQQDCSAVHIIICQASCRPDNRGHILCIRPQRSTSIPPQNCRMPGSRPSCWASASLTSASTTSRCAASVLQHITWLGCWHDCYAVGYDRVDV